MPDVFIVFLNKDDDVDDDTRLLSVRVKCPDPRVASHDQKPDRGIVSGVKSPPLPRTPPSRDLH